MVTIQKRALWAGVVVLVVFGFIAFRVFVGRGTLPEGLIQANGRIEGDHVSVSSKFAGRIAEIRVREGDTVQTGKVLAVLDDAQIKTKVRQAAAAVAALDAQVDAVTMTLAVLRKEVPLAVGGADAGLSRAKADIAKAKASHDQASRDAERAKELLAKGLIPRQGVERADLAVTSAEAEHESTRGSAVQAGNQLSQARLGADRIKAKEADLTALQAQREQAKAGLAEAESVLEDLTLKAPSSGVIMTHDAHSRGRRSDQCRESDIRLGGSRSSVSEGLCAGSPDRQTALEFAGANLYRRLSRYAIRCHSELHLIAR